MSGPTTLRRRPLVVCLGSFAASGVAGVASWRVIPLIDAAPAWVGPAMLAVSVGCAVVGLLWAPAAFRQLGAAHPHGD